MSVKYVIAASSERIVQACRDSLGGTPTVEFRVGSVPECGADCDAAILNFPLAHERYGGVPQLGMAQVLKNERGDGAPKIILSTPPMSLESQKVIVTDSDIEEQVFQILNSCVDALLKVFPHQDEGVRILLHLEAAGIDRKNLDIPIRAISRLLLRV